MLLKTIWPHIEIKLLRKPLFTKSAGSFFTQEINISDKHKDIWVL